mgnify:CR=1 FL=1
MARPVRAPKAGRGALDAVDVVQRLARVLREENWHRTRAARRLGMDRSTLWRKIREYGLRPEDQPGGRT